MCNLVSVTVTTRVLQSVTPGGDGNISQAHHHARAMVDDRIVATSSSTGLGAGRRLDREVTSTQDPGGPVREAPDHRAGQELDPMSGS
jgi:hypothetical protein